MTCGIAALVADVSFESRDTCHSSRNLCRGLPFCKQHARGGGLKGV